MFKVNINFFFQKSIKRENFKLLLYNSLQTQNTKYFTLCYTNGEREKKKTQKNSKKHSSHLKD